MKRIPFLFIFVLSFVFALTIGLTLLHRLPSSYDQPVTLVFFAGLLAVFIYQALRGDRKTLPYSILGIVATSMGLGVSALAMWQESLRP